MQMAVARSRGVEAALQIGAGLVDGRPGPDLAGRQAPSKRVFRAMGDPQAPFASMLHVLERHGMLGDDGLLRPEVGLVSMGDHFDYDCGGDVARAGRDGEALLRWLALHPADQVVLLVGNHDLGRVGELAGVDDDAFAAARADAEPLYARGVGDDHPEGEAFHSRHPWAPTLEVVARDFSSFRASQRHLVHDLLVSGRMRAALAWGGRLLVHAGVTCDDLDMLGVARDDHARADVIAEALCAAVRQAAAGRGDGPLVLPDLHVPGDGASGEGGGIFYHRPEVVPPGRRPRDDFAGARRRRFDPCRLPVGLTQIIGHIQDKKCRELLDPWVGSPVRPGAVRSLVVTRHADDAPRTGAYREGLHEPGEGESALWFVDGGMLKHHATFELLTLEPAGLQAVVVGVGDPHEAPHHRRCIDVVRCVLGPGTPVAPTLVPLTDGRPLGVGRNPPRRSRRRFGSLGQDLPGRR